MRRRIQWAAEVGCTGKSAMVKLGWRRLLGVQLNWGNSGSLFLPSPYIFVSLDLHPLHYFLQNFFITPNPSSFHLPPIPHLHPSPIETTVAVVQEVEQAVHVQRVSSSSSTKHFTKNWELMVFDWFHENRSYVWVRANQRQIKSCGSSVTS